MGDGGLPFQVRAGTKLGSRNMENAHRPQQ